MSDDVFAREPINWPLLATFHSKQHPAISEGYVEKLVAAAEEHGWPYLGEMVQEEQASHHLLDMLGVPCPLPSSGGAGHPADLDARVWRAVVGTLALQERLGRIADWHSRVTGPHGTFDDVCSECGHDWPCDTNKMAGGRYDDE